MAAEWLKWAVLNRRRSRRDCKPRTKNSGNEYPTPLACRRHPEPEREAATAVMAPADSRSPNDGGALQETLELWAPIWSPEEAQLPYLLPW